MKLLFEAQFSTVVRSINQELVAESFYLSNDYEAVGSVTVDKSTFLINEARWDVYRSPEHQQPFGEYVEGIYGHEAYSHIGSALSKAFGKNSIFAKELIAECVRGIIQAETYVYKERGYPTPESYDEAWEEMFLNSCRYYGNLNRVTTKWRQHVGNRERNSFLFHRTKGCVIQEQGAELFITGTFIDSFHHMGVSLVVRDGIITKCDGNILRAPDKVCFEVGDYLARFVGLELSVLTKKELAQIVGNSHGCSHLVDILHEVKRSCERIVP